MTTHNLSYSVPGSGMNFCNAQLAAGTGAGTIKTVAACDFTINGVFFTKAITDNISAAGGATQAAGTTGIYLVTINAAGTVTVRQGSVVPVNSGQNLLWPTVPNTDCVIGSIKVVNLTNPFIPGTTAFGAAGVTATFTNLVTAPTSVTVA
jgi:hypothetical protein